MINGEIVPFIEKLKFFSKKQLLFKLHRIKESADSFAEPDRQIVKQLVSTCITQVTACNDEDIMRLKKYLHYRKEKKKNAGVEND